MKIRRVHSGLQTLRACKIGFVDMGDEGGGHIPLISKTLFGGRLCGLCGAL
jgi:hypothetical protein